MPQASSGACEYAGKSRHCLPSRELKGFQRISLSTGETRTVRLHLTPADLSFWSPVTHQRATEASTYDVWVGDSSTAADHAEFIVPTTVAQPE